MKSGLIVTALAVVVFAASSFTVGAAEIRSDGNELLSDCKQFLKEGRDFDGFQAGKCVGLVRGVSNTVYFYRNVLSKDEMFCEPNGVTNGQRVRIVVKYLEDNPKLLNEPDIVLVWRASMDAYPCK